MTGIFGMVGSGVLPVGGPQRRKDCQGAKGQQDGEGTHKGCLYGMLGQGS